MTKNFPDPIVVVEHEGPQNIFQKIKYLIIVLIFCSIKFLLILQSVSVMFISNKMPLKL